MNVTEMLNDITQNMGEFGTYLVGQEFYNFGDLPELPEGYTLLQVNNDKDIEKIKKLMEHHNHHIDELYPNADSELHLKLDDYESRCFLTSLLFSPIYDYWCGNNTKCKYRDGSYVDECINRFDYLLLMMWSWAKNEISMEELRTAAFDFKKVVRK